MKSQKLYLINSTFPPRICGMADHTANLAKELAKTVKVKVLTANGEVKKIPDFEVEQLFRYEESKSFLSIIKYIREHPPDWVILQYNPFSYGTKFGLNLYIPLTINILEYTCPQVKVAVIVHESFIYTPSWKLAILSQFLKTQLWLTSLSVDAVFTVLEPWADIVSKWFPNKLVQYLPVGSNIPLVPTSRNEIRTKLGISSQTIVLGLFGVIRRGRRLDSIIKAVKQLHAEGFNVLLMYIGLDPAGAKAEFKDLPLLAEGPFSSDEISQRFVAMDIYLVPMDEGISTRNTSFMVGIQHGIPMVATFGESTDDMLMQQNGKSFLLTDANRPDDFANTVIDLVRNPAQQKLLSKGARDLFEREFTWTHISEKLLATLDSFEKEGS